MIFSPLLYQLSYLAIGESTTCRHRAVRKSLILPYLQRAAEGLTLSARDVHTAAATAEVVLHCFGHLGGGGVVLGSFGLQFFPSMTRFWCDGRAPSTAQS